VAFEQWPNAFLDFIFKGPTGKRCRGAQLSLKELLGFGRTFDF
jgi:hypothetical protein